MKRKYIIILSLLCAATSASAQDMSEVWEQTKGFLKESSSRKKSLDPAYVLQPELKWTASVGGTGIRMGADMHSDIEAKSSIGGDPATTSVTLETRMMKRLYKKVVFGLSYGDLGLNLGFEVGNHSPKRNTYFNLGTAGSYYGARVQYYKTHEYVEGTLNYGLEDLPPTTFVSQNPCQARDLSIDGFYAFNRHKFVYTASYGGRIVQRRSVGSWMVASKYLQGDFSLTDAGLSSILKDLNRYSTKQFHVGAGYSYNWVILHQEPRDGRSWKGLQNLTVNLTALPMVSLSNNIYTERGIGRVKTRTRHAGSIAFSPTVRVGACYAWDRYYVTVQAYYNRFGFRGANSVIVEDDGEARAVNTRGVFYDLTAKVQLNVRF